MTEAEWAGCTDPGPMLEHLRGKAGERKLRLFACACCRRVWRLVPEAPGWAAVKAAERCADGLAGPRQLSSAQLDAERAYNRRWGGAAWDAAGAAARFAALACLHAARTPADPDAAREAAESALAARRAQAAAEGGEQAGERAALAEAAAQAALLRDALGSPFRPARGEVAWLTLDVVALARSAYDERLLPSGELDPARLAALAGALEDAGCTNTDVLTHLRGPGPHARGCWVIDWAVAKR